MFTTNIPNKIKQPAICCQTCGKSYKMKSNLKKHEITCALINRSKKIKIEEDDELPSYRELYMMVMELGLQYNKMDKKMDEFKKVLIKTKRKINILDWLNKYSIPNHTFSQFESNIIITDKNIEYLINNSIYETLHQIITDNHMGKQTDTSETFPIFAFSEKQNHFYIYDINPSTETLNWNELSNDKLIRLGNIILMKLSRMFTEWKQKNKQTILNCDALQTLCDKALIKIVTPEFKEAKHLSKLKSILYNILQIEVKELLEYEFEF